MWRKLKESMGLLLVCCGLTPCAWAGSFTITFGAAGIPDLVPEVSRGMLVVDTARDGFAGFGDLDRQDADLSLLGLSVGDRVGDDQVIATFTATVDGETALFDSGTFEIETSTLPWLPELNAGDPIALLIAYGGTLNSGETVGLYRSDSITEPSYGANQSYHIPNDGRDTTILSIGEGMRLFGGPLGQVPTGEFTAANREVLTAVIGETTALLRFDMPSASEPVRIEITTPHIGVYVIERSTDLVEWHLFAEHANADASQSSWLVEDAESQSADRVFYRWWHSPAP